MNKTQKGFALLETLLILVVVAILAGTGYYVWHTKAQTYKSLDKTAKTSLNVPTTSSVKTYDDCVKSSGSIEQETYPPVCVTKSGQRFTQPDTQKYLTIKEWGVKIPLSKNIEDAYYDTPQHYESDGIVTDNFSLRVHYLDAETECRTGQNSLASITRATKNILDFDNRERITPPAGVSLGDYYYYIAVAQYACAQDDRATNTLNAVRSEFTQESPNILNVSL